MNYKAKISASQEKALRQIIATKIDREMRELRSQVETSPTARRRWIWELIQNAKDVDQDGAVRIQIDFDAMNHILVFRHSGRPFTAENIRFLIEQISSKERTKDSSGLRTATGKFGTGFLATHLLSETVMVQGVAKEPELDFKQFEFELDRRGEDLETIANAVQRAKQAVEQLDNLPSFSQYVAGNLNTAFRYPIVDDVAFGVAQAGIDDLSTSLPYVLGFVAEIECVDVPFQNQYYQKLPDRSWRGSPLEDDLSLSMTDVQLAKTETAQCPAPVFRFLQISKGHTTISMPIDLNEGTVLLKPVDETVPKLFCDFPLVGTEVFPFPAVLNNPNFDPTDPRDGIFLTGRDRISPQVENNRRIMAEGVALFLQLVDIAVAHDWHNLHSLANIHGLSADLKWVSSDWYSDNVLGPIREKILYSPVVETAAGGNRTSMLGDDGRPGVWFPTGKSKELRERIWNLANSWFPHALPRKDQLETWQRIVWHQCGRLTSKTLAGFVASVDSLEELSKQLNGVNCIDWLNDLYAMLEQDLESYDTIINHEAIFPNQNGTFCQISHLAEDAGDIDDELKDILKLLGRDIREELFDSRLTAKRRAFRKVFRRDVVEHISSMVMDIANDRLEAKNYQNAFRKLLSWFRDHPVLAEQLFPMLYASKHLLYDEDTVMKSMDKAEQLDQLLTESGVSTVAELKQMLSASENGGNKELLPITQEILASLGISSVEDWQKALQEKDLVAMFSHDSVPTTEMFVYAQSLISIAKDRIIEHLRTLPTYDVSNVEETAPTVLAGITKNGREIQIVARPANSGKVIIYYTAEQDILDFEDSELWVHTGTRQMKVTLGHILKTTGIKKFPI